MGMRLDLDLSQRTEAVLSLLRREEPAVKIARRHGISEATLYRLRDQFLEAGKAGLARGRGQADRRDQQIQRLEQDVARRDRVIGELTIANRILKKTDDCG